MLPVIILAAVAVPLLLIAFAAVRRRSAAGDDPGSGDAVADPETQEEYEREFEQAETYQAEWREEQHREHPDDRLY